MSQLVSWSNEETDELFHLVVKILNGCETRKRIIEKIQKMTGKRHSSCSTGSACSTESETPIEIKKFSHSKDDKIGNLLDRNLNKVSIITTLPKVINKAFSAFTSLKETYIQESNHVNKVNKLNTPEYCLMITTFTESLIYCLVEIILNELKNCYNSNICDISMWASPYITKHIIQKIDSNMLFEISEYGITMKKSWLGEDIRNCLNKWIKKMDYQGLFISNLGAKNHLNASFRFITLVGDEVKDVLLLYFRTIENIPNELNAKLGRSLNNVSKSIHILSLEPKKAGPVIDKSSESFIPGTKIGIIYFPCKSPIHMNCQNLKTKKSVQLELSDDKLIIVDLDKNKYTFLNKDSGIVTYCILTYIFGPT
ncbi:Myb domain containing protein [Cryptosporidium canis]|uniref:Myb domain containing protein n=1 Tax=Cryptosporidium canis TaxID=195482 RepID=A0ABQ8PAY2_9CRYT|nr:Myb domain containing protein [Cryptosporidium canis]